MSIPLSRRWMQRAGFAAALMLLGGCAAQPVTSFQRARTLGPGHVEAGAALAFARQPGSSVVVAEADQGGGAEPRLTVPIPVMHFRTGVQEGLDAGVEAWPGGLKLHAKYAVLDEDKLMLALVGGIGAWSTGWASTDDEFSAWSPLLLSFQVPMATRPLPWLELNVTPMFELMQIYAERKVYYEMQERSFLTLHTGFSVGANFAVWRVRISPEIALLGSYRTDQSAGQWGVYPGVGAFLVY